MKRLFAVLLAALMVLALCSCNGGEVSEQATDKAPVNTQKVPTVQNNETVKEPAKQEPEKESRKEIEALANEAIEKMSKIPEYPEGFPTLEDVVEQYKKAERVAGWIHNTTAVLADPEDTIKRDGLTYNRVLPLCHYGSDFIITYDGPADALDKLIYNKRSLEAYFATLIDPMEAHEFILDIDAVDVPRFVEDKNGALYVLPFSMEADGYGKKDEYELKANDDGSYTFTVHYTLLDEKGEVRAKRSSDFKYVNVDGRWVFKRFYLIKQH